MDFYSYPSYHVLASFGWRIYLGVEGIKLTVVDGTDWIPSHVWRVFLHRKTFASICVCCFLSSIDEAVPNIWWRNWGVWYGGQGCEEVWVVRYPGLGHVHPWFWHRRFLCIIRKYFGVAERHRAQILKERHGEAWISTSGIEWWKAL